MATIVAPGICRYTVNGVFNSRPVANILDMQVDTTGGLTSRDEAIFLIAGDILNNWTDHVLSIVTNQYIAQSVSWVDLNSLDGSTGERSSTSNETWPQAGTSSGGSAQGNVAIRVNKTGTARRGQRQGRMYLCGVNENANDNADGNAVNPATVTGVNNAMEDLLDGINDTEGINQDVQRQLVVIHTRDEEYVSYSDVEALICDPLFGSQRRRLRV